MCQSAVKHHVSEWPVLRPFQLNAIQLLKYEYMYMYLCTCNNERFNHTYFLGIILIHVVVLETVVFRAVSKIV